MSDNKYKTREEWLKAGMDLLQAKVFKDRGHVMPEKLKCSCGFTKYSSGKAIGQCWDHVCSEDGTYEMFICPTQAEAVRVLDILAHEMIHACVGIKEGHKGKFRQVAKEIGLEGKMTATYVTPESPLYVVLEEIAAELGPYPHTAMTPPKKPVRQKKRLVYVSRSENKYRAVMKSDVIEQWGPPTDPWGAKMYRLGEDEDENEEES